MRDSGKSLRIWRTLASMRVKMADDNLSFLGFTVHKNTGWAKKRPP